MKSLKAIETIGVRDLTDQERFLENNVKNAKCTTDEKQVMGSETCPGNCCR